ncbi:MAG: hypothetical protein B7Z78_10515 [Rhodospirillales bacterium 20-60-12]|nr:MAG: hypothetical protein B7Z78_10515 [Rhodospirillales bacterium 20-60-12]HQT66443.1 DUF1489 domain-containing protein [Acetobacteraceae bacterium]
MLHIVKLAVGVRDVPHLTEIQARRLKADPPLRHQTRNAPRRAPEIIDGGSIYWVITGAILVRQRILDIIEDRWDDDSKCSGLVLDPQLIRVQPRAMKPFQGWRYLAPADAPADIAAGASPEAMDEMPADMRRALHGLALL